MANTDLPNGFRPANNHPYYPPHKYELTASQTIAVGDMVYLTSAGRVSIALSTTADMLLGVAATPCTSSTVSDPIWVWDNPLQAVEGQCSGSGALLDPFTTGTLSACVGIEGSTGIMEIDEDDTTTEEVVRFIGIGTDPVTGVESAIGANQRKIFQISPIKHAYKLGAS